MRILLTNDDGINAPGLKVLEAIARTLSDDITVVARRRRIPAPAIRSPSPARCGCGGMATGAGPSAARRPIR